MNDFSKAEHCYQLIAQFILDAREEAHLTQIELSERAGIARSHLAMIEGGSKNPKVKTLWKIAEALDIPLSEFIQRAEDILNSLPEEDAESAFNQILYQMDRARTSKEMKGKSAHLIK